MKILLLGHRDVASNFALSIITSALPQHTLEVLLSGDLAPRQDMPAALAALSAREQAMCADAGRDATPSGGLRGFRELAGGREPGVLARPNSAEGLRTLGEHAPDLVISVRYRRILGAEAIAVARHGVLNLHSGLLPEYKGMMATFWAMLNGDATIGCTAHYIVDAGIDTGPVIGRARLPSNPQCSYLANVLSLYPPGCALIVDAVKRIERGEPVAGTPQPAGGRYYSTPTEADLARFEAQGLRLFDDHDYP